MQQHNNQSIVPHIKRALVIGVADYSKSNGKYEDCLEATLSAYEMMNLLEFHGFQVEAFQTQKFKNIDINERKWACRAYKVIEKLDQFVEQAKFAGEYERYNCYVVYYCGRSIVTKDTQETCGIDSYGELINFDRYAKRLGQRENVLSLFILDCERRVSNLNFLPQISENDSKEEIQRKRQLINEVFGLNFGFSITKYSTEIRRQIPPNQYRLSESKATLMSKTAIEMIRLINSPSEGNIQQLLRNMDTNCTKRGQNQNQDWIIFIPGIDKHCKQKQITYAVKEYDKGRYEGYFKDRMKEGFGIYSNSLGVQYVGQFSKGKRHGYGIYKFADGSVFEGKYIQNERGKGVLKVPNRELIVKLECWDNNKLIENTNINFKQGTVTYEGFTFGGFLLCVYGNYYEQGLGVYEGEISNNQRHGKGTLRINNLDDSFHGIWKNNQMHVGLLIQGNEEFDGTFQRNFQYKYGKQTMKSLGTTYDGSFLEGNIMDGIGKMIFANKNCYEGMFKRGYMHGEGIMKYHNGDIFTGTMVEDKKEYGTYKFAEDDRKMDEYVGSFTCDKMNGYGTLRYTNGDSYLGEFVNGKRHGKGVLIYGNGGVFDGYFDNDKPVIDQNQINQIEEGEEEFKENDEEFIFMQNHWDTVMKMLDEENKEEPQNAGKRRQTDKGKKKLDKQ